MRAPSLLPGLPPRARASRRRAAGAAGVTLVELMVAIVLTSIVTVAIFGVLSIGAGMLSSQSSVSETQMTGRFGTALMALDLQSAGAGTTANCEKDPAIAQIDLSNSCTPYADDGPAPARLQGIAFVPFSGSYADLGTVAAANPQFKPDEIWALVNPYPGTRLTVTGQAGADFSFDASRQLNADGTALDAETIRGILSSSMLVVDLMGAHSVRPGNPAITVPSGSPPIWQLTVSPPPSSGLSAADTGRGVGGGGGGTQLVSAARWVRYRVLFDDSTTNLVREEWGDPRAAAPTSSVIVADNVVDLQISFCLDAAYDALGVPATPSIVCEQADAQAATINGEPEALRTVTITLRSRTKSEDATMAASTAHRTLWYDLDGNTANGVARVRTTSRTVTLLGMGR